MWKRLVESKSDVSIQPYIKKMKLYIDEDVEEQVVRYLRTKGMNILTARELGHNGKPDSFHAAFALKKGRVLLTKNGKDFLDDRKLPFNQTAGVIAIEGSMRNPDEYFNTILGVMHLLRYEKIYGRKKIAVSPTTTTIRYKNKSGKFETCRFKDERGETYIWEDV